jgi:hypothetical protein
MQWINQYASAIQAMAAVAVVVATVVLAIFNWRYVKLTDAALKISREQLQGRAVGRNAPLCISEKMWKPRTQFVDEPCIETEHHPSRSSAGIEYGRFRNGSVCLAFLWKKAVDSGD